MDPLIVEVWLLFLPKENLVYGRQITCDKHHFVSRISLLLQGLEILGPSGIRYLFISSLVYLRGTAGTRISTFSYYLQLCNLALTTGAYFLQFKQMLRPRLSSSSPISFRDSVFEFALMFTFCSRSSNVTLPTALRNLIPDDFIRFS